MILVGMFTIEWMTMMIRMMLTEPGTDWHCDEREPQSGVNDPTI